MNRRFVLCSLAGAAVVAVAPAIADPLADMPDVSHWTPQAQRFMREQWPKTDPAVREFWRQFCALSEASQRRVAHVILNPEGAR